MRALVAVPVSLLLGAIPLGCRDSGPPKGPSAAARAVASAEVEIPPVPVPPPRPQQAEAASDVAQALQAARECLREDRLDRRCVAFRKLKQGLASHGEDPAWRGGLQGALATPGPDRHLALELYAEGGAAPADPAQFLKTLLAIVDDAAAPEADRQHALDALGRIEDPAVSAKALAVLAGDPSDRVRAAAGYLLGKPAHAGIKAEAAVALLRALDADASPSVKRAAVQSLAKLEHRPAVPKLIELIDDALVGPNAIMALAGFEDPKAYAAIFERIERGARTGAVQPAILASLVRLQRHTAYDAAKVAVALEALVKTLDQTAPADPTAGMARDLARRHLQRIRGKLDPAAAPPSAPGKPGKPR